MQFVFDLDFMHMQEDVDSTPDASEDGSQQQIDEGVGTSSDTYDY